MIRWYDYLVALIAADFIMAGGITLLMAENVLLQFAGGISMVVVYDMWNTYCEWRKIRES